eukprot:m.166843 g.166843  ORF g.166843 m.166843 type:complete len:241 (+) comp17758_c0_seq2:82-804(+)
MASTPTSVSVADAVRSAPLLTHMAERFDDDTYPTCGAVKYDAGMAARYVEEVLSAQQREALATLRDLLTAETVDPATTSGAKDGKDEASSSEDPPGALLHPAHDDVMLLRFLRARKFDPKKAAELFKTNMQNRVTWNCDALLHPTPDTWDPPPGICWVASGWHGEDKEGSPIYIEAAGSFDTAGLVKAARREDLIRLKLRMGEVAVNTNETTQTKAPPKTKKRESVAQSELGLGFLFSIA